MIKFIKKRKKLFIICGFCMLLVLAGVLNIFINDTVLTNEVSGGTITTTNFFTTYKADRQSTQEQEKMYLEAIINNANSSNEARANAEAELLSMTKYMSLQTKLEGLISAKGFAEVVVSASENNVSVIVQSQELSSNEVAQIVEVVQTNSDYGIENIKIIPVE
jgi:stage III sporulation protein AH